mgnify:CR=1 FL=1
MKQGKDNHRVIVAFLAVVMVGYIYLFTGVKISKGE